MATLIGIIFLRPEIFEFMSRLKIFRLKTIDANCLLFIVVYVPVKKNNILNLSCAMSGACGEGYDGVVEPHVPESPDLKRIETNET